MASFSQLLDLFLESANSHPLVALNSQLALNEKHFLEKLPREKQNLLPSGIESKDLLWVLSSGSSSQSHSKRILIGQRKLIGLSREALLASAAAVNTHLSSVINQPEHEVWLNVLPLFHVGGLGTQVRARLSGARFINALELSENYKWSAKQFCEHVIKYKATLTSLVPTQVFDLVQENLPCPHSLKAVFVGGGPLQPHLLSSSIKLGWPLLPCYGMTETASQIASCRPYLPKDIKFHPESNSTGSLALTHLESFALIKLPHVTDWRTNSKHILQLKAQSLCLGFLQFDVQSDLQSGAQPISASQSLATDSECQWVTATDQEGWFTTSDAITLRKKNNIESLEFLSRDDEQIKILGELVNLCSLREKWWAFLAQNGNATLAASTTIISLQQERSGSELILCFDDNQTTPSKITLLRQTFNKDGCLAFERLHVQKGLPSLPRTSLGKIIYPALKKLVSEAQSD